MITDELRDCIKTANRSYEDVRNPYNDREILHIPEEELTAIADRIDAEHERMYEALTIGMEPMDEEHMAPSGWVRLPVDADGVPIHVGDVLDPPADCDDYVPLQIVRLMYDGYEQEWFFDGEAGGFCGMVGEHMDVAGWTHHHEPTVEDVLEELLREYDRDDSELTNGEIIERFAAKLRLAGEGA